MSKCADFSTRICGLFSSDDTKGAIPCHNYDRYLDQSWRCSSGVYSHHEIRSGTASLSVLLLFNITYRYMHTAWKHSTRKLALCPLCGVVSSEPDVIYGVVLSIPIPKSSLKWLIPPLYLSCSPVYRCKSVINGQTAFPKLFLPRTFSPGRGISPHACLITPTVALTLAPRSQINISLAWIIVPALASAPCAVAFLLQPIPDGRKNSNVNKHQENSSGAQRSGEIDGWRDRLIDRRKDGYRDGY